MERSMAVYHREKLTFKGEPGWRYIRNLCERLKDELRFDIPVKQELQRFVAAYSEMLTSYFANLQKLIENHSTYRSRVWYLDETGISSQIDRGEKTHA